MKTVILFASKGNNVGKTTTARNYSQTLESSEVYSFADPIREYCNSLFKYNYLFSERFTDFYQYRHLKNTRITDHIKEAKAYPDLEGLTFRDFININSDRLQEEEGYYIWAKKALEHIHSSNNKFILIDDFRRITEGGYLLGCLKDCNIISVNLIKDDVKDQVKTSHEGLLEDFNFDIEFNINPDYTNIPDLFCLLDHIIKG